MQTYRWETHAGANIKLEVPSDWNVNASEDRRVMTSPEKEVELELDFVERGAAEAQSDEKRLIEGLKQRLSDPKIVKPNEPKTQHGLNGFGLAGTGTSGGTSVEWFTFTLGDGKGHGVVALAIAPTGKLAAHGEVLNRIIGSIQPAGAP